MFGAILWLTVSHYCLNGVILNPGPHELPLMVPRNFNVRPGRVQPPPLLCNTRFPCALRTMQRSLQHKNGPDILSLWPGLGSWARGHQPTTPVIAMALSQAAPLPGLKYETIILEAQNYCTC